MRLHERSQGFRLQDGGKDKPQAPLTGNGHADRKAQLLIALDEVMKGRTTFVIAHRLSTIRKATNILVFDAGRIIEYGTFDELLARNGAFAELARAQYLAPAADVRSD